MVLVRKPTALGTPPSRSTSPMEEGPRNGILVSKTKHAKILVVDDDPLLANGIARNLKKMGFEAVTTDGRSALGVFQMEKFHLVISDLDMPYINGIQVIKKIKAIAPDAKIIIYTANESVSDSELLEAGAIDVLHKPVDIETLRNCIIRNLS